jgi:hypothetical protein
MRNAYEMLFGKLHEKKRLNDTQVYRKEIGWEDVGWIYLLL